MNIYLPDDNSVWSYEMRNANEMRYLLRPSSSCLAYFGLFVDNFALQQPKKRMRTCYERYDKNVEILFLLLLQRTCHILAHVFRADCLEMSTLLACATVLAWLRVGARAVT